jgi:predicted Zn-dependent peptidase
VLVRRRPGAALAHLGCFVAGGVTQETEAEGGISTLMARAALRGTAHRSASRLAEDAELLGGTPSATVGTETMQWTIGVPARQFGAAAELLADLVLSPIFPADGIEAERAVALAACVAAGTTCTAGRAARRRRGLARHPTGARRSAPGVARDRATGSPVACRAGADLGGGARRRQ